MEDMIAACLKLRHTGQRRAAASPELESRFEISGKVLRRIVNSLRGKSVPICSDARGYYYAETEAELRATIRQLSSRITGIAKARNGLVRALAEYSGRTSLPFGR